jgi:tetratricopeptide (TPR) repeat protein
MNKRVWLRRICVGLMSTGVCLGNVSEGLAEPSVWASARRPNAAARERLTNQAQKAINDAAMQKLRIDMHGGMPFGNEVLEAGRLEARMLLEQAGGGTSPNMMVRLHYASVLQSTASKQRPRNLKNIEEAAKIITTVIASRPDPAILEMAWGELGVCYALLGERDKEIDAYGQALNFQPIGSRRAALMANRAESFMGYGRLEEAIQGYRDALASLLQDEMDTHGVTTLWGLAVALDRNGDLEAGLSNISLARTYDPIDEEINKDSWFYSPPYDEHWYKAIGAWAKARAIDNSIDRTFEYGHALEAWDRYIEYAPPGDLYVALAKVRRRACELEREKAAKTSPKPVVNSGIVGFPWTRFPVKP